MITGTVNAHREAIVTLRVKGPDGKVLDCDGVIDTGFSGWLSLPPQIISAMQFPRAGVVRALLGDGTETVLDTFDGVVEWDGHDLSCDIDLANEVLIGTRLLAGYELRIVFADAGKVEIRCAS